jgi:hypothetical protein
MIMDAISLALSTVNRYRYCVRQCAEMIPCYVVRWVESPANQGPDNLDWHDAIVNRKIPPPLKNFVEHAKISRVTALVSSFLSY